MKPIFHTIVVLSDVKNPDDSINEQSRVANEIISKFFESSMPKLLSFCSENWPWSTSFRLVQETYLTYIQPWRYSHKIKQLEQHEVKKWSKFIKDNIICYSTVFNQFMRRLLRVNLSQAENAAAFNRLAKIFNQR